MYAADDKDLTDAWALNHITLQLERTLKNDPWQLA
jgi:hypothetical protein